MAPSIRITRLAVVTAACALVLSIAGGQADAGHLFPRAARARKKPSATSSWQVGPAGRGVKNQAGFFRLKGKGARDVVHLAGELPAGQRHELVKWEGGEVDGRPVKDLLVKDADDALVYERHLSSAQMVLVTPSGLRINAVLPDEVQRFRVDTRRFSLDRLQFPAASIPRDIAAQVRDKHVPR